MKRSASYGIAIIFILAGLLILDIYFNATSLQEPLLQSEWFRWRIAMALVLISGIAAYIYIGRLLKIRKREMEFSRYLMTMKEAESRRLASELHDDLQQDLNAIKLNLDRLRSHSTNGINDKLKEMSDTITESIEKIRVLSHNLYPTQLEKFGLKNALERLITDKAGLMEAELNLKVGDLDGKLRLEACIHIYRIVQEILNNIMKHSKANRIDAEIYTNEAYLNILISDNGKGISDYSPRFKKLGGSFGLASMYHRVKALNGSMDIKTGKNTGTKVMIYIPIKNSMNAA